MINELINDQTELNAMKAVEVAVEGLLIALDNTPRSQWRNSIKAAMESVKKLGYGEGYRVGFREDEKAAFKAAQNAPAPVPTPAFRQDIGLAAALLSGPPDGEDKALANSKPTPEEEMEDLGFQFTKAMARQVATYAAIYGVGPESIYVHCYPDGSLGFKFRDIEQTKMKG